MNTKGTPKIEMQDITKSFDNVIANKNVNLKVYGGEIHALLGENGAGKSTLMNMLSGIYSPDGGRILIDGKEVAIRSPRDAIKCGIGMIHQHFKLIEEFDAKENITAGQKGGLWLSADRLREEIKKLCESYGIDIDPDKKIRDMSVSEKQAVEILKVLYRKARILIMDEPTATLTPQEIERLFDIIRKMKQCGCSIIIITHKLREVMELSDRVTVLRDGEAVGTFVTSQTSPKQLIDCMVGCSMDLSIHRPEPKNKVPVMEVKELEVMGSDGVLALKKVSFCMNSGEILGVAGVAGSGQKELCEAIAGLCPVHGGDITYHGESILGKNPQEIFKSGISMSFIPEDRLGMGLAGGLDMVDNVILRSYNNKKGIFIDRKPAKIKAEAIVKRLNVKTPSIYYPVRRLSGGNIQKVLLGREVDSSPHVLITAYPTRGLDIGVTHVIYDILNKQKESGVAILYVGEDLDVLLELADRIMVLCGGAVAGIVDAKSVTKEELGLLMAGSSLEST